MNRVEQHIIGEGHRHYEECGKLCFLSKNLYNVALYDWRQAFFENRERGQKAKLPDYYSAYKKLRYEVDYSALPDKASKQTLKLWQQAINSYWAAKKEYAKNPSKFTGEPKLPRYKNPESGKQVVCYEKGAISKRAFDREGKILLSKTGIKFHTKVEDWAAIRQVRIVPRGTHYVIEVVHTRQRVRGKAKKCLVAGLDVGLNNLVCVGMSDGKGAFVVNGRPLKAINQYYNKKKAELQAKLPKGRHSSKKIQNLTEKRNRKMKDYMHKVSRCVVNQLVEAGVETLIMGKNPGMKQDINIGDRNNQNFVGIPHSRMLDMIAYKFSELEGSQSLYVEESYTSKCSFLDSEPICKHERYKGRRVKRGLFRTAEGRLVNADLNGAYNIMAKHWSKATPKAGNGEGAEDDCMPLRGMFAVHPVTLRLAAA